MLPLHDAAKEMTSNVIGVAESDPVTHLSITLYF